MKSEIEFSLNKISSTIVSHKFDASNIGLLLGASGVCLFLFEDYRLTKSKASLKKATQILEEVTFNLPNSNQWSYASGMTGVAWMMQYLINEKFLDEDGDDLLHHLDDYIFNECLDNLKSGSYDYMHCGLGGILYFLERFRSSSSKKQIETYILLLIKALTDSCIVEDKFSFWWDKLPALHDTTDSRINFGMAHGLPSIISILSLVKSSGIKLDINDRAASTVDYMLSVQDKSRLNNFPTILLDNVAPDYIKGRLAWCYGDLGISCGLLNYAIAYNDSKTYGVALDLALKTTARKVQIDTGLRDACLCHGTSGIGLMYWNLYKMTKSKEMKSASDFWFKKTMLHQDSPKFLGGYRFLDGDKWKESTNLLDGIAGIGLSYISRLSKEIPRWDRCLLLS